MRIFRLVMGSLLLLALIPLLSMGAADLLARIYSCNLDLAAPQPCMAGGEDIGQGLLTLGMMGWFLFATMPAILGLTALWIVVELVHWMNARRSRGTPLS